MISVSLIDLVDFRGRRLRRQESLCRRRFEKPVFVLGIAEIRRSNAAPPTRKFDFVTGRGLREVFATDG
jgi:hypothetical protein